jgi:hypothetical protein
MEPDIEVTLASLPTDALTQIFKNLPYIMEIFRFVSTHYSRWSNFAKSFFVLNTFSIVCMPFSMRRVCKSFQSCIDTAPSIFWREIYHIYYPSGLEAMLDLSKSALSLEEVALFTSNDPPPGSKAASLMERPILSPVLRADDFLDDAKQINWRAYCQQHAINRIDLPAVVTEKLQCAFVRQNLTSAVHYGPRFGYSGSTGLRLIRSETPLSPVFCGGQIAYYEITRKATGRSTIETFGVASMYAIFYSSYPYESMCNRCGRDFSAAISQFSKLLLDGQRANQPLLDSTQMMERLSAVAWGHSA